MKIALLTDGIYPYVMGGMQKHSYYLVKYLAKNQVFVDLYHTNQSEFDINRLEHFTEEEKKYIRSFVIPLPKSDKYPGHYLRQSYEYSKRVYELFRKNEKVDFIYIKGFSGWYLLNEKKKGKQFATIGINFHGYEMFQKPPSFKAKIEQLLLLRSPVLFHLQYADRVFSYGGKITDLLKKHGVADAKIIEVPTGIEAGWINEGIKVTGKKRKFVFLGRYERRKGIQELNIALRSLIKEHDFEFDFIGPIPEKFQLKSEKIKYHGGISDKEIIKAILLSSDILVCPSHSEGMPNVIVEAMATGLAVIATDVGAVNVMVSKKTGWLIPNADPENIHQALVESISIDADSLLDKKRNAVTFVKDNLLWDTIIHSMIAKLKGVFNPVL